MRAAAQSQAAGGRLRPPQKATRFFLEPGLAVDAALRRIVGVAFDQFRANLDGVLRSENPEYVHQLRVSVRRMRCAMRLFPRGFSRGCPKGLNRGLKRLSALLGAVRDPQVLLGHLGEEPNVLDPLTAARMRELLVRRVRAARKALRFYLESREHELLATHLALWFAARPHDDAGEAVLADAARRRLERWHKAIRRAAKTVEGPEDKRLHRLRIRIKRSRYAAEFFRGLFHDKAVRSYLAALGEAQERLGSLTDIKTDLALLRELGLDGQAACFRRAGKGGSAGVTDSELRALLNACCRAGGFWNRRRRGTDHV